MSGRKLIQIDQSEWHRLQRRARELQAVRRDVPRLIKDVRKQTRADVDRAFSRVQAQQRRQDEAIGRLSDRARELEADTTRKLREQAEHLRQDLRETAGRIERQTRERLDEQRRETERALAAERAERRAETARLTREVDVLKADRVHAEDTVGTWLADADTMAELIGGTLPHDRYAPGRLDKVRRRVATARNTAGEGRFDAALAVAQDAFHELSDLRVEIEQRELEHCLARQGAVEALVQVQCLAEDNRHHPVVGPDGQPVPGYSLDVVHWSEGEFDQVLSETATALARARDPHTEVTDLHALRDEAAPRLEQGLGEAVEKAGMRQLASQLRVNLADVVARTLHDLAFYDLVEEESGYAADDPRGSFHARLRNMASGNEIRVEIARADKDSERSVIRVESSDHDITAEAELRSRADAVYTALREQGLPMGVEPTPPVSVPAPGPSEPPAWQPGSAGQESPAP
ncbi:MULTISPECIES: hypothetical protein [unclassified Streptomyces]|uniref:hypothetical protein n=1 Tax=unclassified Streptomyces TaxID=2593676 RepID=UPI002ED5AABF|nr:hypothetical protein OH827_03365 [Streptomyces sp. NBC_00891]WSY04123.1 hypothetical protein OG464_03365 [Streptomyces sp. NBC_00890]WSZ05749.1 hypothetical protein OG704_03365 [Streptomyces sp. NBC_00869]WSZ26755.1 hypothetical protein OG498_30200 [Streptomyces sp. NBC_00870]